MFSPSRLLICGTLLVGWLVFFLVPASALDITRIKALMRQAEQFEQQSAWDKACDIYENILRNQRDVPGLRERYQSCMRRYWQGRRHRDLSYKKEVLSLDYGQALRLYGVLRDTLLDGSLDKKQLSAAKLFQKGLEELDNLFDSALADPQCLPAIRPEAIREFREFLKKNWANAAPANRAQATRQIREVALAAQSMLQLDTTVTIMEFACGACYALDEYTLYLTPNQLRELCDSLRGENVGVGIHLAVQDNKVVIGEVPSPSTPADEAFLTKDDQIVAIDKKPVANLSPEAVRDLLHGPNGTTVDLQIITKGGMPRTVALTRRPAMRSVDFRWVNESIGYVQVHCFQDTTVREIDVVLDRALKSNMSALIMDLRGNSGGLFESAIDAARRFLPSGVITSLQHQDPQLHGIVYESKNPNAYSFPLVVLVDGDTASAAEVLAGALKHHKRARLVGQPTFGKGCTQCLLKLPNAAGGLPTGGLRLTVAKFYAPDGQPYTGRGIGPHVLVDQGGMPGSSMAMVNDQQLEAARVEAVRLLQMLR